MPGSRAAVIKPAVIGFDEGESLDFAGVHGLLKIDGVDAGERFALAYFPFIPPPRTRSSPASASSRR